MYDPFGLEITHEDFLAMMEAGREDMANDLGPLTADDLPTQAEIEAMARDRGCELPF